MAKSSGRSAKGKGDGLMLRKSTTDAVFAPGVKGNCIVTVDLEKAYELWYCMRKS